MISRLDVHLLGYRFPGLRKVNKVTKREFDVKNDQVQSEEKYRGTPLISRKTWRASSLISAASACPRC